MSRVWVWIIAALGLLAAGAAGLAKLWSAARGSVTREQKALAEAERIRKLQQIDAKNKGRVQREADLEAQRKATQESIKRADQARRREAPSEDEAERLWAESLKDKN